MRNKRPDIGPCYDFCSCRWCWNGWKSVSFRQRLRWRLYHIRRHGWRA